MKPFHLIGKIRAARGDELAGVGRIQQGAAEKVYAFFHKNDREENESSTTEK